MNQFAPKVLWVKLVASNLIAKHPFNAGCFQVVFGLNSKSLSAIQRPDHVALARRHNSDLMQSQAQRLPHWVRFRQGGCE
jgi:hypothetical protein